MSGGAIENGNSAMKALVIHVLINLLADGPAAWPR
jgi:hypothetical protein